MSSSVTQAVDDALAEAQAKLETVLLDRILNPPKRPVYVGGKIIGWVEDRNSSDKLLLRALQRIDRSWAERRHHDVQGQVLHEHEHRHAFMLRAEHVLLLDEPDRELLIGLLDKINDNIEEKDHGQRRLPAASAAGDEGQDRSAD